jgi:hypothetical protein
LVLLFGWTLAVIAFHCEHLWSWAHKKHVSRRQSERDMGKWKRKRLKRKKTLASGISDEQCTEVCADHELREIGIKKLEKKAHIL